MGYTQKPTHRTPGLHWHRTKNTDSRVRIRLRLVGIFSPSDCRQTCIAEHDNADKQIRRGLERMDEFFVNLYKEKQWLMFGVILGERPKPIMIMHIDKFNISIYTTSFAREELGYMLPEGVHIE
ncbi:MAG: hypothetical protein LRY41_00195 [Candidatus Pacebacteria bacterium]|nr:hypothetical protein [Candidatus Paceibacterota bacterium]